jgi:ribosome-binding protein aMBF1 (putative translation factor)
MSSRVRTKVRRIIERLEGIPYGFGPKVAYWQMKRGLSNAALAKEVGISVELLERIEAVPQETTSAATRRKLAKALKVTVAELVA